MKWQLLRKPYRISIPLIERKFRNMETRYIICQGRQKFKSNSYWSNGHVGNHNSPGCCPDCRLLLTTHSSAPLLKTTSAQFIKMERSSWCLYRGFTLIFQLLWCRNVLYLISKEKHKFQPSHKPIIYNDVLPAKKIPGQWWNKACSSNQLITDLA